MFLFICIYVILFFIKLYTYTVSKNINFMFEFVLHLVFMISARGDLLGVYFINVTDLRYEDSVAMSLGLSDPNNVIFILLEFGLDQGNPTKKIVFYHLEHNFTGGPPPKHDWASFQFQLGGFVEKTWQLCMKTTLKTVIRSTLATAHERWLVCWKPGAHHDV